jgi:hypothetical protein
MEKVWTKRSVQDLLATNDKAVCKALVHLFNRQTDSEQAIENTKYRNDVGFTAADAPRLTSIAKFYLSRKFLSPKQVALVRKRILKYWKQLLQEIAKNGGQVDYKAR